MPLKFQPLPLEAETRLRLERLFASTDFHSLRRVIEARAIEQEVAVADAMRDSRLFPAKGSEAETCFMRAGQYRIALDVLKELSASDAKLYIEKIITI